MPRKKARKPDPPNKAERLKGNQQKSFLEAYAALGNISAACRQTGVGRTTHYDWLKEKPYAEAFAEAEEIAIDRLEQEARRRAIVGVEEPVFGKLAGKNTGSGQVGAIRKYSDTLLIFLLKGARPHKYRERHEHSGPGGGPIETKTTVTFGGRHKPQPPPHAGD